MNGVWLISADGHTILERFTTENSPLPTNEIQKIAVDPVTGDVDRKSTRLNSSHVKISYAVFCLKKKKQDYSYSARAQTLSPCRAARSPLTSSARSRLFFHGYGNHRDLHSFPTRRSSDLYEWCVADQRRWTYNTGTIYH